MLAKLWWRLVRYGFHLLYNEMAWTYDLISWLASLGEWRAWQGAARPYLHGRRLLEIAHGPGHMLRELSEAGYTVVGLDLSPYMGRLAHKRLRRIGHQPRLVRGQAQTLPFAAASFDTVLSTFPTEFILQRETLTAVHRVLTEDGRFVIVPEGHLSGSGPLARFIGWLYQITGQRHGGFAVDQEQFWPDEGELQRVRAQFDRVGFKVQVERVRLQRSGATVVIAQKA